MEFGVTLKYGHFLLEASEEHIFPAQEPCWQHVRMEAMIGKQ